MKKHINKPVAILIIIFGLITLYLSGSVIFDLFGMREKQGNYVFFVILTNFICGFIYLIGGYELLKKNANSIKLFATALGLLIVTYIGFIIYAEQGGIHKIGTYKALAVRITITTIALITSIYSINKNEKK
jgi:uncharacterized membrane protein